MPVIDALLIALGSFFGGILLGNTNIQEQVKAAQAEVRTLQEENRAFREENSGLKSTLAEQTKEIAILRALLERMDGEGRAKEEKIAELHGKEARLQQQVEALTQSNYARTLERDALSSEVKKLDKWQKDTLETIEAMKLEAEKREALVRLGMETAKKLLKKQKELHAAREEAKRWRDNYAALRDGFDELVLKNSELESKLARSEEALKISDGKLAEAEKKLAEAEKQLERERHLRLGLLLLLLLVLVALWWTYRAYRAWRRGLEESRAPIR